ncbi:MAG: hypothetical protein CMF62_03660 [Magnetococcales bacterium]|nr:hypothetical protein [Magnetococcales bacterium]|tara:strand:+ start:15046 stop:15600 length:555 start_codon:yes stop_codon:yes gene_type:complete
MFTEKKVTKLNQIISPINNNLYHLGFDLGMNILDGIPMYMFIGIMIGFGLIAKKENEIDKLLLPFFIGLSIFLINGIQKVYYKFVKIQKINYYNFKLGYTIISIITYIFSVIGLLITMILLKDFNKYPKESQTFTILMIINYSIYIISKLLGQIIFKKYYGFYPSYFLIKTYLESEEIDNQNLI